MLDKAKLNSVERDLVGGLEEFVHELKNGTPLEKKYTCRRVILDLEPRTYTAKDVKSTRKLLNASQALFAQFLGVSVKAVEEMGKRPGAERDGLPFHGRDSAQSRVLAQATAESMRAVRATD